MIGDGGTTRLFKDGIGAAYRAAKAAAKTAVFHGVNAENFKIHYAPLCRAINKDNQMGKLVFGFDSLVQKARFARRGVLHMTANEQKQADGPRRCPEFCGTFLAAAHRTRMFLRTLHPAYVDSLIWNMVAGNLPSRMIRNGHARSEGCDHVEH
jgi:hypothetical protein